MIRDTFWIDNPDIYNYIKHSYSTLKDFEISKQISNNWHIDVDPEKIRNLRRKENWKKKEFNSSEHFEKVVFINCLHIPFQDQKLFDLLMSFLRYFKPNKLYILGDFLDWYTISYFDKNPKRMGHLQDDLDMGDRLLERLYNMVENVEFLDGNHEYRMIRYLRQNPELYGLKCLEIPSLLHLKERGIKHYSYLRPPIKYHNFQIHHGSLIRKYSGWTAKGHWEKFGGCGIVGHSHRGGNFLKRTSLGISGWYENMCLCSLEPEYLDFADWVQGWSIAYFTKKDLFHLEQVPVIDHQFLFQGKLFQ